MKFAIIAAGEGSRLTKEGINIPKPLTLLNGVPMIERLINIFVENEAEEIIVIVNEDNVLTQSFLEKLKLSIPVPLRIIVKTTPSSMHSFYEMSDYLKDDKFCLTTVDTIFMIDEFKKYIQEFRNSDCDGLMGVTDYIDDEKPLYVMTGKQKTISGFYDENAEKCIYISGGIYCLTPKSLVILKECIDNGLSRMRNFQRTLINHGLNIKAYRFSKIIDVDHAEDIIKAESFLMNKK